MPIFACLPPSFILVGSLVVMIGSTACAVVVLSLGAAACGWTLDQAHRIAEERRRRRGTPPLQF